MTLPKRAVVESIEDEKRPLPDKVVALIRTFVPIVVGAILSVVAVGLRATGWTEPLPAGVEGWLTEFLVALLSAGYYALALWLETKFPRVPWLGVRRTPTYA